MNVIIIHGGVETPATSKYMNILSEAARTGFKTLSRSPLDAAETALNVLENQPLFNAGYGSVLNLAGEAEMDAAICDGHSGRFGAVGAVKNVANPVSVARKVLENTSHVLLVGDGAEKFARAQGFPVANCVTKEMRHAWQQAVDARQRAQPLPDVSFMTGLSKGALHAGDTVGALVYNDGHLIAASSTGGSFLKLPGRVGDTPILGGGILATENGAVVCTGIGEAFIETMTASYVNQLLENSVPAQAAAEAAIARLSAKKSLPGGIIVLDKKGSYGGAYNSYSFPVAVMVDGQIVDFQPTCSAKLASS